MAFSKKVEGGGFSGDPLPVAGIDYTKADAEIREEAQRRSAAAAQPKADQVLEKEAEQKIRDSANITTDLRPATPKPMLSRPQRMSQELFIKYCQNEGMTQERLEKIARSL